MEAMQAQAAPDCSPEATLKRCRFGTLNTSQRNCRLWPSMIVQRLFNAISKPAKPSPLRTLREPACPGSGVWKSAHAAAGFWLRPHLGNPLFIPVGRPEIAVVYREGEPAGPARDSGKLPAADN